MSTFKVPLTTITEINPHPNADSLLLAKVYDYDVIIPKNVYEVGDAVIYIPVGSVLPEWLETLLFPEGSKIKLHSSRIRAIKIRGVVSQGMLIDPGIQEIFDKLPKSLKDVDILSKDAMDKDVAEYLGIIKYTEPEKATPNLLKLGQPKNILKNPEFKEYTDVEHGKYYDRQVLLTGEAVVITQKLHGTSARYGWFRRPVRSLMDRVRNYFGVLPEWEFCWGSRRAQINSKPEKSHPGFKSEAQGVDFGDVYTKIAEQEQIRKKLPKGYAVYGEIVGHGIQKGYLYNLGLHEHKFYVYDVMKDGKYLDFFNAQIFCKNVGLEMVPLMFIGPFTMDKVNEFLTVNAISKEINEGVVVCPVFDRYSPVMGRVKLKYINPDYLLRDNTEYQ